MAIEQALEHDPTNRALRAMAAYAAAQLSWPESTPDVEQVPQLDELSEIIAKHPGCATAYYYRGLIHVRLKRLHPAIADLRRATELNPYWHDAAHELRRLLGHSKRPSTKELPPNKSSWIGWLKKRAS